MEACRRVITTAPGRHEHGNGAVPIGDDERLATGDPTQDPARLVLQRT
jgi:hypothetical protein